MQVSKFQSFKVTLNYEKEDRDPPRQSSFPFFFSSFILHFLPIKCWVGILVCCCCLAAIQYSSNLQHQDKTNFYCPHCITSRERASSKQGSNKQQAKELRSFLQQGESNNKRLAWYLYLTPPPLLSPTVIHHSNSN